MKRIGVFLLCFVAVLTTISAQNTFMGNLETSGVENGYEWVDLGLPSGLKWATCNVGATKPKEVGDLFKWGETTPSNYYNWGWNNYKWCSNASDTTMTKYCINSDYGIVDNKVVLDKKDDAAFVNMGSPWRMPTVEEFKELVSCCKLEQKKKGYKLIGPNGNSIFFPYQYKYFGEGSFWLSSLSMDKSYCANAFRFYVSHIGERATCRCFDLPVRGVF